MPPPPTLSASSSSNDVPVLCALQPSPEPTVPSSTDAQLAKIDALIAQLSCYEVVFCTDTKLHPNDYLLLKTSLLKEAHQRRLGIPQRTNIREEIMQLKERVKPFLVAQGFLNVYGE